jgi:hypothetical protein
MFPIKHYYANFLKHHEIFPDSKVLSLSHTDCGEWYDAFLVRIRDALNTGKYLPVYRVSHGEFIMALGYRLPPEATFAERFSFYWFFIQRRLRLKPEFYSGSTDNSYEKFSSKQLLLAKQTYLRAVRDVSENGILAISFYLHRGFMSYIKPYRQWLDQNSVVLNADNYFSFYMVYVLLCGPDLQKLITGRNVLVVTSFNESKRSGLERAFTEMGINTVHYYSVSPNRAIFDRLDKSTIPFRPDIVLVAAGVGTAGIILQLKSYDCVIIDCGFALDALAFPEKRWNRPYCVDDSAFDFERINFLPKGKRYFFSEVIN